MGDGWRVNQVTLNSGGNHVTSGDCSKTELKIDLRKPTLSNPELPFVLLEGFPTTGQDGGWSQRPKLAALPFSTPIATNGFTEGLLTSDEQILLCADVAGWNR